MYLPPPYAESDPDVLHAIVRTHALGMLVRSTTSGLEADHLPFLIDPAAPGEPGAGTLLAHVARANPLWQELTEGAPVLVVFRGVQGYISPNWYPGKEETHRRVPTWNYEAVHAHGHFHVRDDERFLRGLLARLTRQHEADQPKPWKMGDAPADYLQELLGHIVGIEIRLTRLEGKRKLNQHHSAADREGAVRGLRAAGQPALAQVMQDAKPWVQP